MILVNDHLSGILPKNKTCSFFPKVKFHNEYLSGGRHVTNDNMWTSIPGMWLEADVVNSHLFTFPAISLVVCLVQNLVLCLRYLLVSTASHRKPT